MGNTDREYWFRLSHVNGLGWKRLELMIGYFGSVRKVWGAMPSEWQKVGVPERVVTDFARVKLQPMRGSEPRMRFVVYEDGEYPERLREIDCPPMALFYEGDISLCQKKSIAVVGTRRMTTYGKKVTEEFVRGLVERGVVIVSGLARGVDGVAHKTAIKCGGKTIAVLAHGLKTTYPPEHEGLRMEIVRRGGLILSEYPPEVLPVKQQFVVRDRLVAGLALAILVTESPKKSGTKITVGFAADQGKDVYVVPGPITYPTYEGSTEIIRDGGIPVTSVGDIVGNCGGL